MSANVLGTDNGMGHHSGLATPADGVRGPARSRHDGQGKQSRRDVIPDSGIARPAEVLWRGRVRRGPGAAWSSQRDPGSLRYRIDEARKAVTVAQAEKRRYVELATGLLAIPASPAQRELVITEFIPKIPDGLITDRVADNVDEACRASWLI